MKHAIGSAPVLSNRDYGRRITVVFDGDTSIYELRFGPCFITNEEDARAFFDAIGARLAILGPPRDIVFCLDNIEVSGTNARRAYGVERARLAKLFYRHTARYGGQPTTRVTVMTSGVVHHIEGAVYDSRADAIAAILAARKGRAR